MSVTRWQQLVCDYLFIDIEIKQEIKQKLGKTYLTFIGSNND